jgi:biopolymer transport protein ExbD
MPSKVASRVKRNHQRYRGRHELNVVPMIDMMVILVFFLIFSAVFTRTSILELNFPTANAAIPDLPEGLQLEVVVRQSQIDVTDRNQGILKSLPNTATSYDIHGLSEYLLLVKSKYQDKQDASLLLEPNISYDTLVQVMDTMRIYVPKDKNVSEAELFPDVSVGDAPT